MSVEIPRISETHAATYRQDKDQCENSDTSWPSTYGFLGVSRFRSLYSQVQPREVLPRFWFSGFEVGTDCSQPQRTRIFRPQISTPFTPPCPPFPTLSPRPPLPPPSPPCPPPPPPLSPPLSPPPFPQKKPLASARRGAAAALPHDLQRPAARHQAEGAKDAALGLRGGETECLGLTVYGFMFTVCRVRVWGLGSLGSRVQGTLRQ